jgi:tetratricopeptide (TPR) repeat protein
MKARMILLGLMFLPLFCAIACLAPAQTAKPAVPSHQQTTDAAARKQLATYLEDFKNNPEDATLRDHIIELAVTLKPAPAVPLPARADFSKAMAQMKAAASADDFKAAAKAFEQVAAQAPWYAEAYFNAASAYTKAVDYDSAKRNLALYMAAVRPGVNTQKAEDLQRDIEQQQAKQQFQQTLQQLQANPNDAAREQIIKLAQAMKTPPVIPEQAREHYIMAQTFMERATENSGFVSAVEQYKAALLVAPWWANAYKKLAIAQKAANQYDDAIASLNLYLLTQPADARDAQDEIYKLKADKELAEQIAGKDRQAKEEAAKRPRETGRDGRFIAYSDGTVLDTSTNLMWAAKTNGTNISWEDGRSYCENYRGGGYSDWRMPTRSELATLFDVGKSHVATCNPLAVHSATELIDIPCFWVSAYSQPGTPEGTVNFHDNDAASAQIWTVNSDYTGLALPVRSAR